MAKKKLVKGLWSKSEAKLPVVSFLDIQDPTGSSSGAAAVRIGIFELFHCLKTL